MSETPPPYAAYPRNTPTYGTSAQLRSLYDAYRKYGWIFLANIVVAYGLFFGALALKSEIGAYLCYPVIMIVFAFLTYPLNKKLGFGANWTNGKIIGATVAMAFNSICCGIVGYIVIQQIAANHIKMYGLKSGFFGLKKTAVQQRIAELEEAERSNRLL